MMMIAARAGRPSGVGIGARIVPSIGKSGATRYSRFDPCPWSCSFTPEICSFEPSIRGLD
jgi:hypothetical protein